MEEHGLNVETACRQKEAILQETLKDPENHHRHLQPRESGGEEVLCTYSVVSRVHREVTPLTPLRARDVSQSRGD